MFSAVASHSTLNWNYVTSVASGSLLTDSFENGRFTEIPSHALVLCPRNNLRNRLVLGYASICVQDAQSHLKLTEEEHDQLRSFTLARTLSNALVARAKVILWSAQGKSNSQIAQRLGWTKATVGQWRQRFLACRVAGLYDEVRPGRPRSIDEERVAALLNKTLGSKPKGGTHWSAIRSSFPSCAVWTRTSRRISMFT